MFTLVYMIVTAGWPNSVRYPLALQIPVPARTILGKCHRSAEETRGEHRPIYGIQLYASSHHMVTGIPIPISI